MDNLIFCLNATIPIFLTLMLGYFLRKINLYDDSFVAQMNKFVFKAALPALLFMNVAESDFIKVWDTKFVLFCFGATFCSIAISIGLSFLLNPRDIQGEFVQASYRSSAAILGIAIIQNLYGDAGMAPLMIIASVPLYNITAYCGSRTKHDQNGNQLVMGKSKSDSNWKKNGAKADQLHKSAGDSCF